MQLLTKMLGGELVLAALSILEAGYLAAPFNEAERILLPLLLSLQVVPGWPWDRWKIAIGLGITGLIVLLHLSRSGHWNGES